jgi:hypothetical protein
MKEILNSIPFNLDIQQITTEPFVQAGSDYEAEVQSLIQLAREKGKPKAAYRVAYITDRDDDRIEIDDIWFKSRMLSRNLKSVERVFALVATCGHELDDIFQSDGDMLKQFWWDSIKNQLLEEATNFVLDYLRRKFRLGKTSTMHPGSGDVNVWPIEQQAGLFTLLGDTTKDIGVRLTDSFLMVPNKTISAFLFPTEKGFHSCEVCHREGCPSRRAPFNETLWKSVDHTCQ